MSAALIIAALWVVASTIVAFLPMRRQYLPGGILMLSAPLVIAAIAWQHGWIAGLAALAAFVSMFRKPLRYFWRKWRGLETEVPK